LSKRSIRKPSLIRSFGLLSLSLASRPLDEAEPNMCYCLRFSLYWRAEQCFAAEFLNSMFGSQISYSTFVNCLEQLLGCSSVAISNLRLLYLELKPE